MKEDIIFFRLDSTSVTSEADEAAAVNVAEMMEYSQVRCQRLYHHIFGEQD